MKKVFKVGDKVRRINDDWNGMRKGDVDVVTAVNGQANSIISLEKYGSGHAAYALEFVETTNYHKHHDVIVAWAKGATVQRKDTRLNKWEDIGKPAWTLDTEYRVKPTDPRITELEELVQKQKALAKEIDDLKLDMMLNQ